MYRLAFPEPEARCFRDGASTIRGSQVCTTADPGSCPGRAQGPTLGDLQAAIASHVSLAVPAPLQVLSVGCESSDCGIGNAAPASGLSTQTCRRSLVPVEVDGTADPFATTLCGDLGMKHGDIVFLDVEGLEP